MARAYLFARVELAIAVGATLIPGLLFFGAPGYSGGMFYEPGLLEQLLPWVGVGGVVIGLIWIIRIFRGNLEGVERTWRYHDF